MRSIMIIVYKDRLFIPVIIAVLVLIVSGTLVMVSTFQKGKEFGGKVIVIDAGHGGVDSGANNSYILEKDINLDVALYLQKKLERSGARVIMTRTSDVELSGINRFDRTRYLMDLNARINIINGSGADMFVSVHANSNPSRPSTRGAIALYSNSHPHNQDIAHIFQDVFNTYGFQLNDRTFKSNHIPQSGKYYILTSAKIPGIIVETGFITNSTDLFLLQKDQYREYLAEAICRGIDIYFQYRDSDSREIDMTIPH